MTGYCPDCGNTLCICSMPDTPPPTKAIVLEGEAKQTAEYGEILGEKFKMQHMVAELPNGRVKVIIEPLEGEGDE